MKDKSDVYIIGASGFGREIESWLGLSEKFLGQYRIVGYVDDNLHALDGFPSDYRVLGTIDQYPFNPDEFALIGVADPSMKKNIVDRLKGKVKFLSFIFNDNIIGKNIHVGEGSIVAPNCVISTNVTIGKYVTVNLGTQICHDAIIEDFTSIMSNVVISGKVKIGKSSYIGSNATILQSIEIKDGIIISAGSTIMKNNQENLKENTPSVNESEHNNQTRIWLSPPHMGGSEQKYIKDAFMSNWIAPVGPNIDAFEISLISYCQIRNAAVLSSGTAAIHLALILLGVGAGDEVIASSFTFSATVNPILYLGAIPILVDSEPQTWNLSPETLEIAIKDRLSKGKKPKAIICVHLYGMPANLTKILEIAKNYDIPVIEDAAEALGSRYNEKPVGSFGKIGILSFNGNKIITTSGGGAIVSDESEIINKARFLSKQARDSEPYYQHSQIGYNYRMSNILAGIGLGQMEVLPDRVKKRRTNFEFYRNYLQQVPGLSFQYEPDQSYYSNRWLTTIIIDSNITGVTWENLYEALERENIESRPLWKPMHLQPVFANFPSYLNGISENLFKSGLCLPSGSSMNDNDLYRVVETIIRFLKTH
jgi:sugar O-acyltransferase (sialic acid O-acetyltransferase NeuD family)